MQLNGVWIAALLAAGITGGFCSSAAATSLTEMVSYSNFSNIPGNEFASAFPALQPFDASLGTLNSFSIDVSGNFDITGTPSAGYSPATNPADIVVLNIVTAQHNVVLAKETLSLVSGTSDYAFGIDNDGNATDYSNLFMTTYDLAHNPYYQFGSAHGYFGVGAQPDDAPDFSGSATINGTIALTYNYTPFAVPEPSTWLMFSVGLCMLGVCTRARPRARLSP